MKRALVRYQTKPEQVQENQRLIEAVFAELRAKSPDGVRYLVLKLADGTFVHFAAHENPDGSNPLLALDAFRLFQSGIRERCIEPPQVGDPTIVGNYRMLAD
jgi:predicted SnoaL-like aldol condensation-catalyzing enzyme